MFMPKQPLSVTLEADNLLWLRGRVAAGKQKSLSEALDTIVTAARRGHFAGDVTSVVGTIDIAEDDPGLERADEELRAQFATSLSRPMLVRERAPRQSSKRPKRG